MGGLLRQKRGREGSLLAGPVVVEPAVWANFVPLVEACSAGRHPHMKFWFTQHGPAGGSHIRNEKFLQGMGATITKLGHEIRPSHGCVDALTFCLLRSRFRTCGTFWP